MSNVEMCKFIKILDCNIIKGSNEVMCGFSFSNLLIRNFQINKI